MSTWTRQTKHTATWGRETKHTATWGREQRSGVVAEIWSTSYYPWGASVYPWQNTNTITETIWARQTKH